MTRRDTTDIIIQSTTPNTIGLAPTFRMASTENEEPIRKSVTDSILCESVDIPFRTMVGIGTKVLKIIAPIKKKMNQGILILFPFFFP